MYCITKRQNLTMTKQCGLTKLSGFGRNTPCRLATNAYALKCIKDRDLTVKRQWLFSFSRTIYDEKPTAVDWAHL